MVFHGTPKGRFDKAAQQSNAERKRILDEEARLDQAYNDLNVEYELLSSIAKQKLVNNGEPRLVKNMVLIWPLLKKILDGEN